MKNLKKGNFKIIKVEEILNERSQKKKIATLLHECKQLQKIEVKTKEQALKTFELRKNMQNEMISGKQ